jgi:antitoxin HigA-1
MEQEVNHPGQFIRSDILMPLGLSVQRAADALGVTRQTLSILVNGRASLTPEMALRIEKAFGRDMESLVQMQTAYDVARARARQDDINVGPYRPDDIEQSSPTKN